MEVVYFSLQRCFLGSITPSYHGFGLGGIGGVGFWFYVEIEFLMAVNEK